MATRKKSTHSFMHVWVHEQTCLSTFVVTSLYIQTEKMSARRWELQQQQVAEPVSSSWVSQQITSWQGKLRPCKRLLGCMCMLDSCSSWDIYKHSKERLKTTQYCFPWATLTRGPDQQPQVPSATSLTDAPYLQSPSDKSSVKREGD